nr:BpuSI family type II restriction endonuclease [uncultured Agathobaculum sp.]
MRISYADAEVTHFHPICARALKKALEMIGRDAEYEVLHHQHTGTLEMDFVIKNKHTGKYLCVVEVKRTPADVHSLRYQFQAMSYVQMNAGWSERPFYLLTNLECACAFRYDTAKPKPFQQMLQPGFFHIGNFDTDDEKKIEQDLSQYFSACLHDFIQDSYEYMVTLDDFSNHMEQLIKAPKKRKAHLAALLYEYIRGSFAFINRNELRDIRLFRGDVAEICEEASSVNFKDIFGYSEKEFERIVNIDHKILAELYDFANQNINGDVVAGILHAIVSAGHEHEGEVPTDMELASIVAVLAKYSSGELSDTDIVCDPAAGSGNLLSAAIPVYNLRPTQIMANDVNSRLLELLSLRLGLRYASVVSPNNSPAIYNRNLADVDRSFFHAVKVVVMNPPFSAGINCVDRKKVLYQSIRRLVSGGARSNVGQMPLEGVFLELLVELVNTGTTISCVFPKTHLMGRGPEAKAIRKLLMERFGLHLIFTYPGNEIFDSVTKDTCIIVGRAKTLSDYVKVISSYDNIPDVDLHRFTQILQNDVTDEFSSVGAGIVAKKVAAQELLNMVEDGWRALNQEMNDASAFIKDVIEMSDRIAALSALTYPLKRGCAGNNGGSDMLFFDSNAVLYQQFEGRNIALSIGMRNAKLDRLEVGSGDSAFLDASINTEEMIKSIIEAYNALPDKEGRQPRKRKTHEAWMAILDKESKGKFAPNSVLIPRAVRTTGRVYLSFHPLFVSTNFVVCTLPSADEAILMATWMSTIFYQLICEASAKDQEGMRKMEIPDIKRTYIPVYDYIEQETVKALSAIVDKITFLDLRAPEVRQVDRIWANALFGERADEVINRAKRLLKYLANRRNPRKSR